MKDSKKNKNSGFSLMSTVVYIAIISSVMTSFVFFVLAISDTRNKNYAVQEVQSNARIILNFISQNIRLADDVITPSESNSSNSLELDMPDTGDNMIFSLNNGVLEVTEGGEPPVAISSSRVNIMNLNFTNLAEINYKDNIKIDMDIKYNSFGSKSYAYRENYNTSVSVRH